ncbi:11255_t:CDS:2, partial [Racocetra fulgida]
MNTWTYKHGAISVWSWLENKHPNDFFKNNILYNFGDDNIWAVKFENKHSEQEIINAFARFGIDLEISWKPRITDLEYLWHYFRLTREFPQLKPAPRLLVVHNDKQTFMCRSNLRIAKEYIEECHILAKVYRVHKFQVYLAPTIIRGQPIPLNENLRPKVQEFYNLIKNTSKILPINSLNQGDTIETVSDLNSLLNQGPFGSLTDASTFMYNYWDDAYDEEFEHAAYVCEAIGNFIRHNQQMKEIHKTIKNLKATSLLGFKNLNTK